ncbi:PQQ-binding-like beta-propeller repeat protein [Streptomyces sp. 1331.2]|uniref:PQQ-binding-like beta-propeller repeat protein n=1 Tax=Streptomyces sp. 1331.2 TaxID=1938835 RepID=UPI000BCF9D03|nr:PQQ-binding-like beta-propeller repeat protein [Streptomyces sp. 1331.2]SOB88433.1 Outer membrane protein assembly factor BamB, contains PQQ-like beta-propeller repeat [Streptomyces sp. 1331.2]
MGISDRPAAEDAEAAGTAGGAGVPPRRPGRRALLAGGIALAVAGGAGLALSRRDGGPSQAAPAAADSPSTTPLRESPTPMAPRADSGAPEPLWTFTSDADLVPASTLVANGTLFTLSSHLTAIDTATGSVKWAGKGVNTLYTAAGAGLVFVGSFQGATGYDAATGAETWLNVNRQANADDLSNVSVLRADDKVLYAVARVRPVGATTSPKLDLLAFSIDTHEKLWSLPVEVGAGPQYLHHAVADGNLYYTDGRCNLVARNGQDGRQLWLVETGATSSITPAVADGRAYCRTGSNGLRAVNLADGRRLWEISTADGGTKAFPPVTAASGTVYGGNGTAAACAWDSRTGQQLWTSPMPFRPTMTEPVLVQDTLFVAGLAGDGVHAVDVRTGRPRWTFTVDAISPAAQNQPWGLATDGQRLLAKLGSTVFALPAA